MNSKTDEIIFGVKRAGVTWLHKFESRAKFNRAKLCAKRLGFSLSQLLCDSWPRRAFDRQSESCPKRFTHEDRESHGLKIQITECDEFTRRALERQAAYYKCSVEEFIIEGALCALASDEELTFLEPETGEVVADTGDFGSYIGWKVEKRAKEPPPSHFARIPIPRGAIVESCA
jgi:hypothetical protein